MRSYPEKENHGTEAQKYLWNGAIPLQIHLHESEITTLPAPPPALILGPRLGYLPLLVPLIKPHFSSTLPPGADTVWFDYKGLPLKWYIQTGVLFDLLCAEPERPWNLTVHFRGYPDELLSPCEGEDSVKWSFINSLKEAAYIINGNCKSVMNMSHPDQLDLWRCIVKGDMEGYLRIASRLKLGALGEDTVHEIDITGPSRTGRIPVRLYVRNVNKELDDLEDVPAIDSWDKISYINRPVEIRREEGKNLSLRDALKILLPELFGKEPKIEEQQLGTKLEELRFGEPDLSYEESEFFSGARNDGREETSAKGQTEKARMKLVRIQGIEPELDIPFSWVVNNLMNPEYFLHISLYICSGDNHS